MQVKKLYLYNSPGIGTIVTLNEPDAYYSELVRIIADEGKVVTRNGTDLFTVVDADSATGFYEIDAPEEELYE